jgi:hypothetical protein
MIYDPNKVHLELSEDEAWDLVCVLEDRKQTLANAIDAEIHVDEDAAELDRINLVLERLKAQTIE